MRKPDGLLPVCNGNPIHFLETEVFQKYPSFTDAVGFKLFYYHAREDSRKVLWDHLKEQRNVHIIHLKRRNSLRVLLSRKKAHMTDRWTDVNGALKDTLSIPLSREECLEQFAWIRKMWALYDRLFCKHPKMDVFYEDLVTDRDGEMDRVQAFLGVAPRALPPGTHKQAQLPLSEAVTNYRSLKRSFLNTRWGMFFEE